MVHVVGNFMFSNRASPMRSSSENDITYRKLKPGGGANNDRSGGAYGGGVGIGCVLQEATMEPPAAMPGGSSCDSCGVVLCGAGGGRTITSAFRFDLVV